MAQIDIRNATVRIRDGYIGIGSGLVNLMGGYAIGLSILAVDGFVGSVANGDMVGFASHNTRYTVTAHTNTLGNTVSITISPPLVAAILDDEVITILPHQIEVTIGDGNCTYDEKRGFKYIRNRGSLDTVRQEQDEPVEVSIDATWEFLRGDTSDPPTIEDALKRRGPASAWISSSADKCEPYAVTIEIEYNPPCSNEKTELIEIADFRYESFNHDLKQGLLAVKGKANVTEANVSRIT
jgi:hypothetical protein